MHWHCLYVALLFIVYIYNENITRLVFLQVRVKLTLTFVFQYYPFRVTCLFYDYIYQSNALDWILTLAHLENYDMVFCKTWKLIFLEWNKDIIGNIYRKV